MKMGLWWYQESVNNNENENSNGLNGGNMSDNNGNDGNRLAESVGMLQQQLKKEISNAVENKAYTAENPSMGGFQQYKPKYIFLCQ